MAILINGVRVDSLEITRADEGLEYGGKFSLIKEDGTVLAKQSINGYSPDLKLNLSAEVAKKLRALAEEVKSEIETMLGIKEDNDE